MHSTRTRIAAALVLFLAIAWSVWAQSQADTPPPEASQPSAADAYMVTDWPTPPPGRYHEDLQEHLNRMAAQGWRLHSIRWEAPRAMIFERATRR